MTALLLALALLAEPCDLEPLTKEERRLGQIILSLENDDPRLPALFEAWDAAVAKVDACLAEKGIEAPVGN